MYLPIFNEYIDPLLCEIQKKIKIDLHKNIGIKKGLYENIQTLNIISTNFIY